MESLYVCLFSNGLIKVGRSATPHMRLRQHAERVSCVGIDLDKHHAVTVTGDAVNAERALIAKCWKHSDRRHANEWFYGLSFEEVCEWANSIAKEGPTSYLVEEGTDVDFSELVQFLMANGWKQTDIGAACKLDQSTVSDLANGRLKEPRYSVGVALVRIAKSICPIVEAS